MFYNLSFHTPLLRSENPPMSWNFQHIHPVIKGSNWCQSCLLLGSLKIWTVTLENFIYEDSKIFNAILCPWHYYIPNFRFLASPPSPLPPELLPPLPELTEIWEMLTINYYKPPPPNEWFQLEMPNPLFFNPPSIQILSIDFPDLSPNSNDII